MTRTVPDSEEGAVRVTCRGRRLRRRSVRGPQHPLPGERVLAGFASTGAVDAELLGGVVRLVLRVLDAAHEQPQTQSQGQAVGDAHVQEERAGSGGGSAISWMMVYVAGCSRDRR